MLPDPPPLHPVVVLVRPDIDGDLQSTAWLACLCAAASAIAGMRSAETLAQFADELYAEWLARAEKSLVPEGP